MQRLKAVAVGTGLLVLFVLCGCGTPLSRMPGVPVAPSAGNDWKMDFGLSPDDLTSTGRNPFFVLEPGFQLVLEGGGEKLTITVLDETETVGAFTTRVIEEREEKGGELREVSRNYFAISKTTGDVFYFGEAVDIYRNGKVVRHSGAWRADVAEAKPGLIMPGKPAIGMKYYQEVAPGEAMDRAEVVSLTETLRTPAGIFKNCLQTKETTPLNPKEQEYKTYAPGIGLVQGKH